jgi:hypothetical protein
LSRVSATFNRERHTAIQWTRVELASPYSLAVAPANLARRANLTERTCAARRFADLRRLHPTVCCVGYCAAGMFPFETLDFRQRVFTFMNSREERYLMAGHSGWNPNCDRLGLAILPKVHAQTSNFFHVMTRFHRQGGGASQPI